MTDGVVLRRDKWGIGHVVAPDTGSMFSAQGWVSAADRIWQMEWDRRRGLGRWAEVVGPAAVGEDQFFRRLGLAAEARDTWSRLLPATRAMTEAYAVGVNAWLAANEGDLPAELDVHPAPPEPWEPWHSVLVYQVRHLFMGTFYRKLWRGALTLSGGPDLTLAKLARPGATWSTPIVPATGPSHDALIDAAGVLAASVDRLAPVYEIDGGSNSWALDGSRTASGLPLLAGDPHRGIEFPNAYHQIHLSSPELDVIGLAFPGVPGLPHFGHNDRVAWCITHGMADDTDVFVEHDPVEVDRVETIEVAGAEPVEVDCGRTPRGPVVLGPVGDAAPTLSLMWTALHGPDTTFDCLLPMLGAATVDELEAAVVDWVVPINNLLSADVDGSISFHLRGRVVERPVANRLTPVPGDADHAWTGLTPVPFDRLHAWRNPERGYLVTANNRIGTDGPYISLDFANSARHDRIVELLDGLSAATVDDMAAVHGDTHSRLAAALGPLLAAAVPATGPGEEAMATLAAWDHRMDTDSAGAAVYGTVRRLWTELVTDRAGLVGGPGPLGSGWPPEVFASRMRHDGAATLLIGDGWLTVPGIDDEAGLAVTLGALFDRAAADLAARFGSGPTGWRWGDLHTMVSPHPLAAAVAGLDHLHPPVDPVPGDAETVRCGSVAPANGDRASAGSVARYAFDLGDWDRSGWVVPHGVSGVRGSGHDLDQRADWLACRLLPMAYTPAAVATVTVSTERLTIPAPAAVGDGAGASDP